MLISVCEKCNGIWFDKNALAKHVKGLAANDHSSVGIFNLFERRDVLEVDQDKEKEKVCPRCGLILEPFNYMYDSNIILDRCRKCMGLWTDPGEVEKLVRFMSIAKEMEPFGETIANLKGKPGVLDDLATLCEELTKPCDIRALLYPKIILPLSDENPREKFPFVTVSLIFLNVGIFLLSFLFIKNIAGFFDRFGLVPADFFSIGTITSMFLHGGIFHLLGNMLFLWLFGDNVEDRLGFDLFLVFYLFCGIGAGAVHSLMNMGSEIPAIGASGAISGVMGAYFFFYPKVRIRVLIINRILPVPAFLLLGCWFVMQLIYGAICQYVGGVCNVAFFAHIGGFVIGAISALLYKQFGEIEKSNQEKPA